MEAVKRCFWPPLQRTCGNPVLLSVALQPQLRHLAPLLRTVRRSCASSGAGLVSIPTYGQKSSFCEGYLFCSCRWDLIISNRFVLTPNLYDNVRGKHLLLNSRCSMQRIIIRRPEAAHYYSVHASALLFRPSVPYPQNPPHVSY